MAINERLIDTEVAAAPSVSAEAEQNLVLHLDANDVDSYDGDGSVWYDISEHDVTIPLSDNADDLELHLNASDSTSYGGSGTTWTDISGNSRNGTINGAPTYDINRYGSFDFTQNTGDYVEITTDSSLQPASTGTTYEFWITPDTSSDTNTLLYYGTTDGYGFWLWNFYGTPYITTFNSSNSVVLNTSSGHSIANNTLAHVVFTLSSDVNPVVKIYVDGELKATATGSGTIRKDSAVNIVLGRYHTGNANDFEGKMSAARIYSKALSASEIGQNYRHGIDYIYTDLADDTNLELHFDAADLTSAANTTWTDKKSSVALTKSGTVGYDDELGDWIDFGGGYYGNDSHTDNFEDSSGNTTVEFWYNPDSLTALNAIIQFRNGTQSRWHIGITSNTFLSYYYGTSRTEPAEVSTSTLGISVGKWYHFTVVKTPTSMKYYIDGELKETDTFSTVGSGAQSITGIRIGDVHFISGYGSDGQLGQLRVYKSALTADEVMQNYLFTKNDYPNTNHADLTSLTHNSNGYFTYDSTADKAVISNAKSKGLVPNSSTDTTLLIWARLHSASALSYFLTGRNQSSSINNFYFRHYNNNLTLAIYDDGGTRDINQNFGTLSANTWYLLGFRTTTDGSVRVNAITTGSSTFTDATATMSSYESTDVDLNIGFYQTNFGFDGDIGKVSVYNKYLSDSEITSYFDSTKSTYGL